jgi:protein gp37
MAINTKIQWCDSSMNIQMGCEGCELVKGEGRKPTCYAKLLTDRYAGLKGWPESFEKPKVFMDRLNRISGWSDLTGKERLDKPWLNGAPRVIFLNDMGDTFSRGLPEDWFAEALPIISQKPHLFLVLTKWPKRFAAFSRKYTLPWNVCAGTSVTSQKTAFRIDELLQVQGGGFKWLSVEPMWSDINFLETASKTSWIVFGGESGRDAAICDVSWIQKGIEFCKKHEISSFVKQVGSKPFHDGKKIVLKDGHGGDMDEWPDSLSHLKIREFPKIAVPA